MRIYTSFLYLTSWKKSIVFGINSDLKFTFRRKILHILSPAFLIACPQEVSSAILSHPTQTWPQWCSLPIKLLSILPPSGFLSFLGLSPVSLDFLLFAPATFASLLSASWTYYVFPNVTLWLMQLQKLE